MSKTPPRTEVAAHMSFDIIRYSQLWEDSDILSKALSITPKDNVLSITSSGDNVLALLLKESKHVLAVDLNPTQNAVLALKVAAYKHLDHKAFLELFGFQPSSRRGQLFESLSTDEGLKPYERYWQDNRIILESGIIYEGRLDKFLRRFAQDHFSKVPGIAELKAAFTSKNLALQQRFIPLFNEPAFRDAFVKNFGQAMLEQGRDPAQFRYVTEEDTGKEFFKRMVDYLSTVELFGNHYIHYFIFGEPMAADNGPDYARAANFDSIKKLIGRLEIRTQTIEDAMSSAGAVAYTKANLSNIFEYMSEENMIDILRSMSDRMPKGSRIAYWNLLVDRPMPEVLKDRFKTVPVSGPKDRVWFYKAFYLLERI